MNDMKYITINKNRGWRGLAEVAILNEDKDLTTKHIFSFSQKVWDDMIFRHTIVIQSEEFYYVIHFTNDEDKLPKPDQQRSVLIKNYTSTIDHVDKVAKTEWTKEASPIWSAINTFRLNKNNHTTSDWNCIGIRVIPEI